MHWFKKFFSRRQIYRDLSEEIQQHLQEKIEELVASGMGRDEATQRAKREFGNAVLLEERSREVWRGPVWESFWLDLKYGKRQLRRSPGLTLTAVLTLALGMGVNTSIFTVFHQVLLRTMPVRKPADLVLLQEQSRFETGTLNMWGGDPGMYFSYPAYQALRDGNGVLEGLAVSTVAPATIVSFKDADKVKMQLVSGNYFTLLGVQPALGRLITPADDTYHEGRAVAVLSDSYWHGHFGSDPSILNQEIQINGSAFTVVGVVRHEGLMDAAPSAVFLPISMQRAVVPGNADLLSNPLSRWLNLIGRLSPGVTRMQAEAQLNTLWWNWRRDVLRAKESNITDQKNWLETHLSVADGARGIPLLEGTLGRPIRILETMAFVVLLIACGNVTNLLLAKAVRKHSELALRGALGASHRRIFQQVISEGLLLGLMGAASGLLLGWLSLKLLLRMVPSTNTLRQVLAVHIEWPAIAFCAAAGVLTSVIFSIAPAILSTRIDLLDALHRQSAAVIAGGGKLRNVLVAGEIALSLGLLIGATAFGWSLYQLRNIKPGYATEHILTFRVDASVLGKFGAQVRNEYTTITESVRRQPGVQGIAYAAEGLISGGEMGDNITLAGYAGGDDEPTPDQNWITSGFFSTIRVPLLAGREFTDQDTANSERVAVVDEAFVKHYFGGDAEKALRGQFGFGGGHHVKLDIRIVGVIPTIRATSLTSTPGVPFLYLPYDQSYSPDGPDTRNHPASFYVSTNTNPAQLVNAVRSLVHSIDRNLPITGLETMEEHLSGAIFETRMVSTLSGAMGGLALALAAIGLYSLLAFVVTQRKHEIGVRIALGAQRQHISSLVAKQVSWLIVGGLSAGSGLGWAGLRMLASRDATLGHAPLWLFASTGFGLAGLMFSAAVLPARHAASIDPMQALRTE
jgi:putative ABC transport system permease protein